jgi:hypothetical protein
VSRPQRVIGQQEYVRLVTLGRAGHCWPGSQDAAHHRQFGVCDDADATGLALDFFGIPTTYQPMNHP